MGHLILLAGTRAATLKTGVKTLGGRISFLLQSLPMKIIITYLINVFDTTWGSKFWVLKFLFLGQFSIFFHADLKAIKAFESVLYLVRFLRKPAHRVKVDAVVSVKWCGYIYIYRYHRSLEGGTKYCTRVRVQYFISPRGRQPEAEIFSYGTEGPTGPSAIR